MAGSAVRPRPIRPHRGGRCAHHPARRIPLGTHRGPGRTERVRGPATPRRPARAARRGFGGRDLRRLHARRRHRRDVAGRRGGGGREPGRHRPGPRRRPGRKRGRRPVRPRFGCRKHRPHRPRTLGGRGGGTLRRRGERARSGGRRRHHHGRDHLPGGIHRGRLLVQPRPSSHSLPPRGRPSTPVSAARERRPCSP